MGKSVGRRLFAAQAGATAVEYALIVALIAVSSIAAWSLLGTKMSSSMTTANAQLSDGIDTTTQAGAMAKN